MAWHNRQSEREERERNRNAQTPRGPDGRPVAEPQDPQTAALVARWAVERAEAAARRVASRQRLSR